MMRKIYQVILYLGMHLASGNANSKTVRVMNGYLNLYAVVRKAILIKLIKENRNKTIAYHNLSEIHPSVESEG